MSDEACATVIYRGTVQGVGFRYTTRRTAAHYAVTGYVRNLSDGTVEVIAEGLRDQVQAFLGGVLTSSVGGYVSDVDVVWSTRTKRYNSFDISY